MSRDLFFLRLVIHLKRKESVALFAVLEATCRQHAELFFRQTSDAALHEHLQTAINSVQHALEQTVGDLSKSHIEILQLLQKVQATLDALQWVCNRCPALAEETQLSSEALADLSLVEREIERLRIKIRELEAHSQIDTATTISETSANRAEEREEASILGASEFSSGERMLETCEISQAKAQIANFDLQLSEIYGDLLSQEVIDYLQESEQLCELSTDRSVLWDDLQRGENIRFAVQREIFKRGQYASDKLKKTIIEIDEICNKLRARLEQLGKDVPALDLRVWWSERLRGLLDNFDDQMSTLDDQDISLTIMQIEHLQKRATWLASQVLPLYRFASKPQTEAERTFYQSAKQLKNLQRRLRAESQERKLQHRLETKLGRRTVALSENLIIVLILLVLGLLIIEASFVLSPSATFTLMWVDTAICGLFLLEFGTKLYFAEGRWLYFRRHFLIDFLPAIPFGFFFWLLQTQLVVSSIAGARALRLLRLARLARYIRILMPIIRIYRLLSFMVRAIESILRKYETIFNRNVIIFPHPTESNIPPYQRLQLDIKQLRQRCRRRSQIHIAQLGSLERLDFLREKTAHLRDQLLRYPHKSMFSPHAYLSSEIVYLHKLVENMVNIDAIEVEEILGQEFIQQSHRIFRYLSLPGIRVLPGFRRISRAYRSLDPAALVAWAIRGLGRFLQKIQALIHWFGDLYGIVTGPQVLDRIGTTLINATLRPARRLLTFGLLFIVVYLLINAFSIGFLAGASTFLAKYLGTPIIILGSISLIPLLLGFWFKRIASSASEFFTSVAEAQFIGHLKQIKQRRAHKDLVRLIQRVIEPEAKIRQIPDISEQLMLQQLLSQLNMVGELEECPFHTNSSLAARRAGIVTETSVDDTSEYATILAAAQERELKLMTPQNLIESGDSAIMGEGQCAASQVAFDQARKEECSFWIDQERVLFLYSDYLSSSPLHRSDTTISNQLVGNITIQNIRQHHLTLSFMDNMRINRLDLSRPRLFHFLGPYLWFSAITYTLSLRIARLLIAYNQNAIPLDELSWLTQKEREEYEAWLQDREARVSGSPAPAGDDKSVIAQAYRTTVFTALHFLSPTKQRDKSILETFGPRILELIKSERRQIMREMFGYYPFHRLPKENRTVNVFQFFINHISGGRFFLLPFKMLWWVFSNILWLISRLHRLVREVLRPPSQDYAEQIGHAPFEVAVRKINRMRKPIFTEYMRLRSLFDTEYLGLFLPGLEESGLEGETFRADLEFIGALKYEYTEFEDIAQKRSEDLKFFDRFLTQKQWHGSQLAEYLQQIAPKLAKQWRTVLRAITAAYAADYRKSRSLLKANSAIDKAFYKGINEEHKSWKSRCSEHIRRCVSTLCFIMRDKEYERFINCWQKSAYVESSESDLQKCWHYYLANRRELAPAFLLVGSEASSAFERVSQIMEDVMRHHTLWSEEIITLRTLQTLTRLDLQLYRELLFTLGEYQDQTENN